jgi:TM2 domain-containing membrane protein YozV
MLGFLIKKSFWDYWDRMGLMILMNLLNGLTAALCIYPPMLLAEAGMGAFSLIFLILAGGLFFLVVGANSRMCSEVVNSKSIEVKKWFSYFKEKAKKSLFFYLLVLVLSLIIYSAMKFYGSPAGNAIFLGAFFFVFWVTLLLLFTVGYFFPLSNVMDDSFGKNVKKCFMLFFDNPGISIFVSLISLFLFLISAVTALLAPGLTSMAILWENLMKFLMLKYDFIEENPDTNRKKIPWDVVLRDEKETLGNRGFGEILRPWK